MRGRCVRPRVLAAALIATVALSTSWSASFGPSAYAAAPGGRLEHLATELARWGVTRICPIGQMQNPPLTWRHDGRPSLADLVSWTDWEQQ